MTQVRFISTTSVQPETHRCDESVRRIELTPWDLQLLLVHHIQKGILFHRPTPLQLKHLGIFTNLIDHLKSTFSRALDVFYPLAGRLVKVRNDDSTTSFFLDCSGTGAQFVHAVAEGVTLSDILDPVYVPNIVNSFFLLNNVLNYEGISTPLLAVQVTELVDGLFIACTANHSVIDGTSFWDFINTWSEISRNPSHEIEMTTRCLPIFDKSFLDGIVKLPIHVPNFPENEEIERKAQSLNNLQQRVFHFPRSKIAELKAKANAEMGIDKISSLQALLAHLWRSTFRARNLPPDHEVYYTVIIGVRQRMKPPMPNGYVGNAVLLEKASSTAGELSEEGLGQAAWKINRVIASQTGDEVKKFLENWVKSPELLKISNKLTSSALITGSSPRFNVYGNDFGWGKPLAVRSGVGNKFDGKLTVFEGAEEGSIDFEACLLDKTLEGMGEDAEFMEAVIAT